jgi:uncharacterized protein
LPQKNEIITTLLDVSVQPKSSQSRIRMTDNGEIKVYLNSPPVDGKANSECIELFSKKLKIAKGRIDIDKGEKGKKKRIAINGISREEVMRLLKDEK